MIPTIDRRPETQKKDPAFEAAWYRESLLRQVDACKSTDDRAYLLATLVSYPAFAIALDTLVAAGVLMIKTRRRSRRDPQGFKVGESWLSDPAVYRVPAKRTVASWAVKQANRVVDALLFGEER